ncbi:hypothetical protein GJ496_005760 [Pomphorhynchus laevis]|nr:hypothetical protein GJ496_005760 [Pomphorhynchus laevis]
MTSTKFKITTGRFRRNARKEGSISRDEYMLLASSLCVCLLSIGFLCFYLVKERHKPVLRALHVIQTEIKLNPKIYGAKHYNVVYFPSVLLSIACMISTITSFLSFSRLYRCSETTRNRNRGTNKFMSILRDFWLELLYMLLSIITNALLVGSMVSALIPSNTLQESFDVDIRLIFLRAKFRDVTAFRAMEEIHDLMNCCGIKDRRDWVRPPYEQTPPVSCLSRKRGCLALIQYEITQVKRQTAVLSFLLLCALLVQEAMIIAIFLDRFTDKQIAKSQANRGLLDTYLNETVQLNISKHSQRQ